jgi:DNA helicase HerA-like ATPase
LERVAEEQQDKGTDAAGDPMVGRILGTQASTPLEFWVGVAEGEYLQLDEVVTTERTPPGGEPVQIAGIVTQVTARIDGARFDSDIFLIEDGILPGDLTEAAQVTTTRVEPEVYVPPLPGAAVQKARGKERERALFFDGMDQKLPAGVTRDNEPIYINLEFLDGTKGAHVNISGISGIATKTSYATFLLYSLFNSGGLGKDALNSKAIIFNVKGEDLLFLDHHNTELTEKHRAKYRALELDPGPFPSTAFFAPPRPGDPNGSPDVNLRSRGVTSFFWTIEEFCKDELLPFVFADVEDDRQQYTMVVHNVTARLKREATAIGEGGVSIEGREVRTFAQLIDFLVGAVQEGDMEWAGPNMGGGTINAFVRRLMSARRPLERLIRGDIPDADKHKVTPLQEQVTVVDLHNLPDRAKRFVVGVILRRTFEEKERQGPRPHLFVVLDELNKYAPREGSSPIKEILLDVAERGRSLGIILIGAQQTASEVEARIVGQSAIRVVGRLDSAEAERGQYGFLRGAQRERATIMKPGTMMLSQPEIPIPLVLEFPFPAWATRHSEAGINPDRGAHPDDPLEGLPKL